MMQEAVNYIVEKIKKGDITSHEQLEMEKVEASKIFGTSKVLKNAEILAVLNKTDYNAVKHVLKTKPVRTLSGVANIAVMWMPDDPEDSCRYKCVYCPQGKRNINNETVYAPKAYTGVEPTTMRALRFNYDPYLQVTNRLRQFKILGHSTDKCELIIMGGTFTSWEKDKQELFIKRCFDAFNEVDSATLEEAKLINENAENRCIGLTIETRADHLDKDEIEHMLSMGCTRVEIGIQSTDDKILNQIQRGHDAKENMRAIEICKKAGLKITAHWMPGLTGFDGIDFEKEVKTFEELFTNPAYRPDELKIYPTLVIEGTKIFDMWKSNQYEPLTKEKMISLLIELKKKIPPYIRVKRVMRDISEKEVTVGPSTTNLRQLSNVSEFCNCIRCREIGVNKKDPENVELNTAEYDASNGKEFFISFEDFQNKIILGFLRLRIDEDCAKVRELHVYGEMAPIGMKGLAIQHKGLGKKLLSEAEKIAVKYGKDKIRVTSGVGVRVYYEKLGYSRDGNYMSKLL